MCKPGAIPPLQPGLNNIQNLHQQIVQQDIQVNLPGVLQPNQVALMGPGYKRIHAPAFSSQQYLNHCPNATKALCEKYDIHVGQQTLPTQDQCRANFASACHAMGFPQALTPEILAGITDFKDERLSPDLRLLLGRIANRISNGEEEIAEPMPPEQRLALACKTLSLLLQTAQFQEAVQQEEYLQSFRHPELPENAPLAEQEHERLVESAIQHSVEILNSCDVSSFSETEMRIALEKHTYNAAKPADVLRVMNRAAVLMMQDARAEGYQDIADGMAVLLGDGFVGEAGDSAEVQLDKLGNTKKALDKFQGDLEKIVKENRKAAAHSPEAARRDYAQECLDILEALNTQIVATARYSLQDKIRKMQADIVNSAWKEGTTSYASFHLEVGPEFAILGKNRRVGARLSFTYNYALSVTNPRGSITIANSIQAGLKAKVDFNTSEDPVSGALDVGIGYGFSKFNFYKSPEELLEHESHRILTQLMHYVEPPALPTASESGFVGGLKQIAQTGLHILTSIGHGIKSLCTGTSRAKQRQALMENTRLQAMLVRKGIFGRFDELKRESINEKKSFDISMHSGKINANGKITFRDGLKKSANTGHSAKLSLAYNHTNIRLYKPLLTHLGDSAEKISNYLKEEYGKYAKKSTRLLRKEIAQFNAMAEGSYLSPEQLLKGVAELTGEFQWFCDITNQDDLSKSRFALRSPRSAERNQMMLSRSVGNRGEFLRALMTRCAALKLQLLQRPQENLDEATQEKLALCQNMLTSLTARLEDPPVILSKSNSDYLNHTTAIASKSYEVAAGLSCKFTPLELGKSATDGTAAALLLKKDHQADIEVSADLNLSIPTNKTKFYGSKFSGSLSFSLTGDTLIQYGSQIATRLIAQLQQQFTKDENDDSKGGLNLLGNGIADFGKDLVSDIANDLATSKLTDVINEAIYKHTVHVGGGDVSLSNHLQFLAEHSNTFTVTINFKNTSGGLRYGGLNITNTRNNLLYLGGTSASALTKIGVSGEAYLATGKSENVLYTLGTNSFAPLIGQMTDIRESSAAMAIFCRRHKRALKTMTGECLQAGTKLHAELQDFMNALQRQCTKFREELVDNDATPQNMKLRDKAQALAVLTAGFLNILGMFENHAVLDERITNLKSQAVELMAKTLRMNSTQLTEEQALLYARGYMDQQGETLPSDANLHEFTPIMNLAGYMQTLDYFL